jgi:hypothetical protein
MDFELDLSVCSPISLQAKPQQFAIVFQLVDQTAGGPVVSKKQIRLGLALTLAVFRDSLRSARSAISCHLLASCSSLRFIERSNERAAYRRHSVSRDR